MVLVVLSGVGGYGDSRERYFRGQHIRRDFSVLGAGRRGSRHVRETKSVGRAVIVAGSGGSSQRKGGGGQEWPKPSCGS